MSEQSFILGAVAYDPKVVTIWDGFQEWFGAHGPPFDYILYTSYERQVAAHFAGHIQVAWNSPLAWLQSERLAAALGRRAEAVAMRDSDRDLTSIVIARTGGPVKSVTDLKGGRVAVGASDSPQATLIPLNHLARLGLEPHRDFEVVEFDRLRGKHGDHIGGERDAARALRDGDVDAACMIDGNHLLFIQEGTLPAGMTRSITQTRPYDHCNFTVLDGVRPDLVARFRELLFQMSYADAEVRRLFDLEGLKHWLPGRTAGYAPLAQAVEKFGYLNEFISTVTARCA